MASSQSLRRGCPIVASQTGGRGGLFGNVGSDGAAGITKARPGDGAEEGKAITTPSRVSTEITDNTAQAQGSSHILGIIECILHK